MQNIDYKEIVYMSFVEFVGVFSEISSVSENAPSLEAPRDGDSCVSTLELRVPAGIAVKKLPQPIR
ncbi:MAG: hypothetical protein S4CHLAM2_01350 [Chlamydiales bacterium]|nr:hypothetical protein [Chlamydiales bacterium]